LDTFFIDEKKYQKRQAKKMKKKKALQAEVRFVAYALVPASPLRTNPYGRAGVVLRIRY
jgi:hypothetical protein